MASTQITTLLTAMALFGSTLAPALAQQGTEAQRDACMPDAFRLCTAYMPDAGRVESCLRNAGPRLSPACYAVFNPVATNQSRTVRLQSARDHDDD